MLEGRFTLPVIHTEFTIFHAEPWARRDPPPLRFGAALSCVA
jgi:hypothetical protein